MKAIPEKLREKKMFTKKVTSRDIMPQKTKVEKFDEKLQARKEIDK